MAENISQFDSRPINDRWLDNIYQNLTLLEEMERMAREGCHSIMEYLQIPLAERQQIIADVQYKNLKLMINEISLLLTDLSPQIGKESIQKYQVQLDPILYCIKERKRYVRESWSASRDRIIQSKTTEWFNKTLDFISNMRLQIINEIAPTLFLKRTNVYTR